jgi:hypothetical protein
MHKTLPLLLALPLIAACSSASSYMRPSQPGAPPGADEAMVIFCRPNRMVGAAVTFDVWDRTKLIGFAEKGCRFEYRCAPGKHLFLAQGEDTKALDADLAASKTYYVWVTPRMGVLYATVGFTPVTRDSEVAPKVWKALAKSKHRELNPELALPFEKENQAAIRKLMEEFEGARKEEVLKLTPEDGYPLSPTGEKKPLKGPQPLELEP